MSISVLNFITDVRAILQDTAGVRWDNNELIRHIGGAYSEIVLRKPELGAKVIAPHALTATQARQAIPSTAFRLLAINSVKQGTGVTTPVQVDRVTLSAQNPNWANTTTVANTASSAFIYEPDSDPGTFYLYPRPLAGTGTTAPVAELVVAEVPVQPANTSVNIALPLAYVPMIRDYVLYRSYAKDGTSGDANKSMAYYNLFTNALNALSGAITQQPN
jgi:hypothetical protein